MGPLRTLLQLSFTTLVAVSACSADQVPCLSTNHCVLDADGNATCETGYDWQDPTDPDNFVCVAQGCVSQSDAQLCGAVGANCDGILATDDCDVAREVQCGSCTLPDTCGGGGTANVCGQGATCTPQSDSNMCAAHGWTCGLHTGLDNCGVSRSVDCGPCGPGDDPWLGEFEVAEPDYSLVHTSSSIWLIDLGPYLLGVWEDGRGNGSGWATADTIVASRFTRDGTVLDPGGIMLVDPGATRRIASVLFDGSEILILYQQYRGDDRWVINMQRLDTNGGLLDPAPILFADDDRDLAWVQAHYDGSHYVVAWISYEEYAAPILYTQSVTPGTLELGPRNTIVDTGAWDIGLTQMTLAQNGDATMMAWMQWDPVTNAYQLRTTLLELDYTAASPGGDVLADPLGDLVTDSLVQPHYLEPTPEGFALFHEHTEIGGGEEPNNRHLDISLFSRAAVPMAGPPWHVATEVIEYRYSSYRAQGQTVGARWLLSYSFAQERRIVELDTTSQSVVTGPTALSNTNRNCGGFRCNGQECVNACPIGDYGNVHCEVQRYTHAGVALGAPIAPGIAADLQTGVKLAFDGQQYLVGWQSETEGGHKSMRVRRLGVDGHWLDNQPLDIPLTDPTYGSVGLTPYPNGGFLVRWAEEEQVDYVNRVYASKLNADGTWAWAEPKLLVNWADWVWFGDSVCTENLCILGHEDLSDETVITAIDGNGDLLHPPQHVTGTEGSFQPMIRIGDTLWLATSGYPRIRIYAIALSGDDAGILGEPAFELLAPDGEDFHHPMQWLTVGGATYLAYVETVTHEESLVASLLNLRPFDPPSGLGAPQQLLTEPVGRPWGNAIVVNGELITYLYGWGDDRETLLRAKFDQDLQVIEPPTEILDPSWFGTVQTAGSTDTALFAYDRIDWDVGFGDMRVRLRWIGDRSWLAPDGDACSDDGQCAGGRCRDGLCCDGCDLWKGL